MNYTDVLVIGSGIAGLTAAIKAGEAGLKVTVVNKAPVMVESNTYNAQGGIVFRANDDTGQALYDDIVRAGSGVNNPEAVKFLVENGPREVYDFLVKKVKVPFSRNKAGELDLTKEAAHSTRRIIHSDDITGRSIELALYEYAEKISGIKFLRGYVCVDIITPEHHLGDPLAVYTDTECLGAYFLNSKTGRVEGIRASATILATGGLGQIYSHTTNPKVATGDGCAAAARTGLKLINMEYTQFHPTTLFIKDGDRFLISESVRGEGAVLKDRSGREFMNKYHKKGSLAPRDVVSRAIHEEMLRNNDEYVLLDISGYMDPERIKKRFPYIYNKCLDYGIDITKNKVPVVPAMHFSCGGIKVNLAGATEIKRLYAVGEVSCTGLHGANRLASTSLLEGLVWAGSSVKDILSRSGEDMPRDSRKIPKWDDSGLNENLDPALLKQDWITLRNTMWNYVGLVRSRKRLHRAINDLTNLKNEVEEFYRNTRLTRSLIELRNAIETGLSIAQAAWTNKRSLGCHYRKD